MAGSGDRIAPLDALLVERRKRVSS